MKHYRSLIKLKKREVDGFRKQMGRLIEQRAILDKLMDNLRDELETEVNTAGDLIELGVFFGDFSGNIKDKQEKVAKQQAVIDEQMDAISAKMMVVFSEQKKFELALEAKLAEQKAKRAKDEQDYLDELASTRHQA